MNIDLKVLDDVAENSGSAPTVSNSFGQGRKLAVASAGFVHPYLTLALKHFRINRFQALRTDA